MRRRLLRLGLPVCAVIAVVLVGAFGYISLRGGAPAHARAHSGLTTHPAETLSFATTSDTSTTFYLSSSNSSSGFGGAGTFIYGGPYPFGGIAGDWTGKGYDSIGVYDINHGTFYLRNSNTSGYADIAFAFGPGGCYPIAGDWTGKGYDSVGVYCPGSSVFYLRNSNTSGYADIAFAFGPPNDECKPVAGDWTGKGYDSVGVFCANVFYLRNSNTAGNADIAFTYGPPWVSQAVAGDWIGQGIDTLAVRCGGDYQSMTWCLRNSNTPGNADTAFTTRNDSYSLLAGHWTPPAS